MGGLIGCIVYIVVIALALFIGVHAMVYTLATLPVLLGLKAIIIPVNIVSVIVGAVLSEIFVPLAIVTWLISLFV